MCERITKHVNGQSRFDSHQSYLSRAALSVVIIIQLVATSWAQMSVADPLTSFLSGQVTAVQEKTLQIDNKNYEIKPDVTVKDEEGSPMELSDIVPGAEVKFLLKQSQIAQIILILPK
jgi:hypothetical protein